MGRIVGNATKGQIEARYQILDDDTEEFDEIVALDATVHLEKMSESTFALIVETQKERACFMIGAKRAHVEAHESWREPAISPKPTRTRNSG